MIPVTVMGLGLTEAVLVDLFARVSISPDVVLALMLTGRVIHLMIMLLIFFIWTGKNSLYEFKDRRVKLPTSRPQ